MKVMCQFGTQTKISMCHLKLVCAMALVFAQKKTQVVKRITNLRRTDRIMGTFSMCSLSTLQLMEGSEERAEMWKSACLLTRLVSASVRVSERAGREIKAILSGGQLGVVQKGHNDFQTAADRAAQLCIVNSLHRKFGPDIHIIGEEEGLVRLSLLHPKIPFVPNLLNLHTI